jgi:alpha-galactosidase
MYPGNIQQQQPYPGYNNNNNNNNNNNMPQQNPFINLQQQNMQQRQAQGRVFHLNLTLIFKLGLMVVVLSQGGSNERLAFLIAAAIMIYIYQTMRPRRS